MSLHQPTKLVAIVGRQNVGKSTLFNKLIGQSKAIASAIPGTTRDVLYGELSWNKLNFSLADTAGLTFGDQDALNRDVLAQTKIAAASADLIIFVVDIREGLQTLDLNAAELIRKLNKPVLLAVNKSEGKKYDDRVSDFYTLGLGEPILISAIQSRGLGDLLDEIVIKLNQIRKPKVKKTVRPDRPLVRVAVLGRPNVGKSTLFNKLVGHQRAITNDQPGTTRDTVSATISANEIDIELIDTAGLRRRGKVAEEPIEKLSYLSLIRGLMNADIALLLIEGDAGIVMQDLHIAQIVLEEYKGLILVINKWDLVEKDARITADYDKYLSQKINFAAWVPHLYVSALTGQRADEIIQMIKSTWQSLNTKIPTKSLNNIIASAYSEHPPVGRRSQPKIYFASQRQLNPPTIMLKINYPEEIHFSYLRYLEKKIRAYYPMVGAPLNWQLVKSTKL